MNARVALGVRIALTLVVVVGLGIDAYVHFDLASNYEANKTSTLSQGDLFRAEAVIAILAALALLVRPRRYTALITFAVAAGGLAAVLIYRYVEVGKIGPIPAMYEPFWFAEKNLSAYAEAFAAAASAALFVILHRELPRRNAA